jgi:LacI family transcriptional regulator
MQVMGGITIKDVAREAGVSPSAVSHALNPNPNSTVGVSEKTARRVREAVQKVDYRPHCGARSMRSNRFKNIGVFVVRQGEDSRPPEGYLMGVFDAAQKRGYQVSLVGLDHGVSDYCDYDSSLLREECLDALIVACNHRLSPKIHKALDDLELPVVYVNDRYEHNAIWLDDCIGGHIMTDYLQERGYRKIAFVLPKYFPNQKLEQLHCSAEERIEGYCQSMAAAGLEPDVRMIEISETVKVNQRIMDDWLYDADGALPEAIFAYDDDLANIIAKMLMRKNIRMPEDIALAGYNGTYASLCAWRPLTTVRIPCYEMGRGAFEMALNSIGSIRCKVPSIRFRPELVIGEST